MNVFELSTVFSPLAGAISGGITAKSSGGLWIAVAVVVGLIFGILFHAAALGVSAVLSRVPGVMTKTEGLNPVQWLASFLAVVVVMAAPFTAAIFVGPLVARLLHI